MARTKIRISGGAWIMLSIWILLLPLKWIVSVIAAAMIHELGHLTAIWLLGGQVRSVEIGSSGAKIRTNLMDDKTELVCALAGPAAGALICLFWRFFPEAALAAAVQTLFNLLPIYPMDGGRAIGAIRNICCK